MRRLLEPAGLEIEDGELLVEREILASGKSRAFVGSRPVAVSLLKELARIWATFTASTTSNFSSWPTRSARCSTFSPPNREPLDRAASLYRSGAPSPRNWRNWSAPSRKNCACSICGHSSARKSESAAIQPDEDVALDNERRVLQNVQKLEEAATTAYSAVYDAPESAVSLARVAARRVDDLCRIDPSMEAVRENLRAADLLLQEASYALRDYLGRLEANPGRLEEIETRLAAIDKLKRKYGQSIPDVLVFLEEVRRQIAAVEHSGERMEELRASRNGWRRNSKRWLPT